jgi:hypothetical protein
MWRARRSSASAFRHLTLEEAVVLLEALQFWAEDEVEGNNYPGCHTHVTDSGRELSVAVDPGEDGTSFAKLS